MKLPKTFFRRVHKGLLRRAARRGAGGIPVKMVIEWKMTHRNSGFTVLKDGDFPVRFLYVNLVKWPLNHGDFHRKNHSFIEFSVVKTMPLAPIFLGMVNIPPLKMGLGDGS